MRYPHLLITAIYLFAFLSANSQTITTFAGTGSSTYGGDGGPATAAGVQPHDVTIDNAGNIYIVDRPARIRKVNTAGIISTYAGNGIPGYSGDGGAATNAQLNYSNSITVDNKGNLYISDGPNNVIRKVDTAGIITTFAGSGAGGYYGDGGPATAAGFLDPYSVFVDSINGNVYIADGYNSAIRMIDTSGTIWTIAGNGTSGYSGDGGPATASEIYNNSGFVFDKQGNLYLADGSNYRIRRISNVQPYPVTITGIGDTVCPADSIMLTDITAGGIWTTSNSLIATVSSTGTVYGVTGGADTALYTVTAYTGCSASAIYPVVSLTDCTTATNNVKTATGENIDMYPNPANAGEFFVNITTTNEEMVGIVVMNITGQVINKTTGKSNSPIPILLNAPAGVYFVTAKTASNTWNKEIINR